MARWRRCIWRAFIPSVLILFLMVGAAGADEFSTWVWDANGDGVAPVDNLCNHGYDRMPTGEREITIAGATSIASITFDLYYTTCGSDGEWIFSLNGTEIGRAASVGGSDCSCTPAGAKWPQQVTVAGSAVLGAWNFGGANTVRIATTANAYASYYGVDITYETTLHPVINPSSQSLPVGAAATFDASGSTSDTGSSIVSYAWDFGDGATATGTSATHSYPLQGNYTVTLTIQDDAGLISTAKASVTVSGPPEVTAVPWRYNLPHETWNGKVAVLKGVVRDSELPLAYTWDFGDGSAPQSGTIGTEAGKYAIEATHTYPDSSDGTPYRATLTVTDPTGNSGSARYEVVVRDKSLDVETNVAIDDGLWWLHKRVQRSGSAGVWSEWGFDVAPTASAVLAFEVQGHRPDGNPYENPYVETVRRGLNHLFTRMRTQSITSGGGTGSPYGESDTNGNGIGIDIASDRNTYEIGMAMMALAASGTPDRLAETGLAGIKGRSYRDILTDLVDICAWGQEDSGAGRGGWNYWWNSGSRADNSITQWPAIGLEAAESSWGIVPPDFVKRELEGWLTSTQCSSNGGWGYDSACYWVNPAKTGAGIAGLSYIGKNSTNSMILQGLNFLKNNWAASGNDGVWNNKYAMYAIMKGMRIANPEIALIGTHDWYSEFARHLVDNQQAGGNWPVTAYSSGQLLDSAWSILILTPSVVSPPPVAELTATPLQARPGAAFLFDASTSYHLDPGRQIVRYDFAFGDDSSYTETPASAPDGAFDGKTTHVYPDTVADLEELPGQKKEYVATVTVTDDTPEAPKSDSALRGITLSLDNHPPVSAPGGPYTGYQGLAVALSGVNSFDPDGGPPLYNHIEMYAWELDGTAPYDFDDAVGMTATWVWHVPGVYNIALRVTDRFGATHTQWTTVTIKEGVPTQLPIRDRHVNYGDTVELQARLLTAAGDPLPDQTVTFSLDANGNNYFDPEEVVGSVTTNAVGAALLPYTTLLKPGTYPVKAEFAGNTPYFASVNTTTLRVEKEVTTLVYSGDISGQYGQSITLRAVLRDDEENSLASRLITLSLGSQGGSGITNTAGVGDLPLVLAQYPGSYSAQSSFAGDEYYASSTTVAEFIIINTPPVANAGGPYSATEGSTVYLDGSASRDTDGTIVSYTWDLDGDGQYDDASGVNPTFIWQDNFSGTIGLFVTDNLGTEGIATAIVSIANAAPKLTSLTTPFLVPISTQFTVKGNFSDPGTADLHTATCSFGDGGTAHTGIVNEANGSGTANASSADAFHIDYALPGVYEVIFTVTDDDGASGQATATVVAYDPSAGFVTGGGWIDSLAGAYKVDESLAGRANFGFVSKYQKGATKPTGQTEFNFQTGNLNFHSSSYDWLVVTGGNAAQYKGTGTINGSGAYRFMLWAGDGTTDTFRIRIWTEDNSGIVETPVYDNASNQPISGGSIVIHTGKTGK